MTEGPRATPRPPAQGPAQPGQHAQGSRAVPSADSEDTKTRLRPATQAGAGSASSEPSVGAKISGAFASAKDQMRANANPDSKKAADVAAKSSGGRRPRRARLRLTRIDPWSVMKAAFLLSVALGIVTIVAVTIVWGVLGMAGVWESINTMVQDVVGGEETADFNVEDYLGMSRVLGFTMLVAVVDVVLLPRSEERRVGTKGV